MFFHQVTIRLPTRGRGFHLVTSEILAKLPELARLRIGFLHLFLQHTSASLMINENADPDVRDDLERWANEVAPDGAPYLVHTAEGDDDMTAHIKSGMFGVSLNIPVRDGKLQLGTWQGVYLGEHRDEPHSRTLVATIWGEERASG